MFSLSDPLWRTSYFGADGSTKYVIVFLLVAGVWGGDCVHSSALAQQVKTSPYSDHRTEKKASHSPAPSRSGQVENLPDWAESSESFSQGRSRGSAQRSAQTGGGFRTKGHNDRHTVPVEGGSIWLFLAGIGYGVFRLGWKKTTGACGG